MMNVFAGNREIAHSMRRVDMPQLSAQALIRIVLGGKQNHRLSVLRIERDDRKHNRVEKGDDHDCDRNHDLPIGHKHEEEDGIK